MGFRKFEDLNIKINTLEENDSQNCDLPETLEDDEFPHLGSDQAFSLRIRFSLEEFITRRFSSKGK